VRIEATRWGGAPPGPEAPAAKAGVTVRLPNAR
jgi:hypothetical protein